LLTKEAESAYVDKLIPKAPLVTRNLFFEVKALLGKLPTNIEDMISAAREFKKMGSRYVLGKGGYMAGAECTDILYDGQVILKLSAVRIHTDNTHGSWFALSAAVTASLAKGMDVSEAVKAAKIYIARTVKAVSLWQRRSGHRQAIPLVQPSREQ
jgi:hydroxymethylpyrimidine/phosphomethylpyrimidine kinase